MMLCVCSKDTTVSNNGTVIYQHLNAVSNYLYLWKIYENIYLPQDNNVTDARFDVLYLLY